MPPFSFPSPSPSSSTDYDSFSPTPLVKVEPQDDSPDGCFIIENPTLDPKAASFVSSQALAPPTEVPLRATQAPKKMKGMMGVFRINPFAMHNGSEGKGSAPTVGWEPGPLEEEPVLFEFQLDLIGYGDSDEDDNDDADDNNIGDPVCGATGILHRFPTDFDCVPSGHMLSEVLPPSTSVSPFGAFEFHHQQTRSPQCAFGVPTDGTWNHDVGTVDMTSTLSSSEEERLPPSSEGEHHFQYAGVIEASPNYPSVVTPNGYGVQDVSGDHSLGYPTPRIDTTQQQPVAFDTVYGIQGSSASVTNDSDIVQDMPLVVVGPVMSAEATTNSVVGGGSRDQSHHQRQHRLYDQQQQYQQQQYPHHHNHQHHHHHSHSHHPYLRPTSTSTSTTSSSMSNNHQIHKLVERYHPSHPSSISSSNSPSTTTPPTSTTTTTTTGTTRGCTQMYEDYEEDSYEYEYEHDYDYEYSEDSGKSYGQQQQQQQLQGFDVSHLMHHHHHHGSSPPLLGSSSGVLPGGIGGGGGRVHWSPTTLNTHMSQRFTPSSTAMLLSGIVGSRPS
ncbi:hypothetical protein Agabi119p4_8487 [Agaricus bisporus var. burnettii]|uniref:Uncharacterized protein n=1 Tax=Agaricus bisporus var. burnettii TaxID=192524 RepID=A0A8H7EYJ9_AGABI|nr:hypothetical protein Agabi119p4_8487 [Agaricus bisporus var. burnettii]